MKSALCEELHYATTDYCRCLLRFGGDFLRAISVNVGLELLLGAKSGET